jgi:N-acetylglutamate synthase-like GNAT family acetyltransferase
MVGRNLCYKNWAFHSCILLAWKKNLTMTKPELERAIMTQELWVDILPWRNDPLVYVWSRTDRPISLIEHRAWFEARKHKLADEPIFSYHKKNLFIGMARLDKVAEDAFEVSLLVNPNQRSGGYGKQILADVCKYFLLTKSSDLELIAVVHQDNLVSQSLFTGLGFNPMSVQKHFKTLIFSKD